MTILVFLAAFIAALLLGQPLLYAAAWALVATVAVIVLATVLR